MRIAVFAVALALTACGSTAAAPTPTPIRTAAVVRTAAPSLLCQGAPNQPSAKATINSSNVRALALRS